MITVTPILMYSDPDYTVSVTLDSLSFKMRFYSNTRNNLKHFDIYDALGVPVVLGVAITPYFKILEQPSLQEFGLKGYFVMMPYNPATVFENVALSELPEKYGLLYISE